MESLKNLHAQHQLLRHLFSKREEEGFTLVELIVVIIIMAILSQIGMVSFNRYIRRSRAFAAETVLRNIKQECETNRDLGVAQTFTPLTPNGYSIQAQNSNSCLGESGSGLVSAIPENQGEYPSYFYNFHEGNISCSYSNSTDDLFPECERDRKTNLESNDFVVKDTYLQRACSEYVLVQGSNWDEAQANAQKIGGNLATINDQEESRWLTNKLKWIPPENTSYGAYSYNQQMAYWIGLNDKNQEGKYEWADGTPMGYRMNPPSDGDGSEDYFTLVSNGEWNDISADNRHWQTKMGIAEIPTCNG